MRTAETGDHAMLIAEDNKRFFVHLQSGAELQTHHGVVKHAALIGLPWGTIVHSHLGRRLILLQPTIRDLILHIKRRSQIVFPKDIGYALLRLSVGPGSRVLEAGTGSGAMTMALAWYVGPQGSVLSIDRREDMLELARNNLQAVALQDRVSFTQGELAESLPTEPVDAVFLDLPAPHQAVEAVMSALKNGGCFGAIVPTVNQVSALIQVLSASGFADLDVCETLLRFYKLVPERLRPTDRMVAHTGYLIFARRGVR